MASTTATMSATTTQRIAGKPRSQVPLRPSQGPLKSTWHKDQERPSWQAWHWIAHFTGIDPIPQDYTAVKPNREDPIPVFSLVRMHAWIDIRLAVPIAIQWAYTKHYGQNFHPIANLSLWTFMVVLFGSSVIRNCRRVASKTGFLQADAARDGIPDTHVGKVVLSLILTAILRPLTAMWFTYDRNAPVTLSPWLLLQIPLYTIATDFWFYWYHRIMHESNALWKYHRRHHTAKHPTPALTLFADSEQEWFDISVIPILAYLTVNFMLPMGFYDWVVCWTHVMFVEIMGHSGLRAVFSPPALIGVPLEWFDAELIIEDHDKHHSNGWKTSGNYGKQTRIWDRMFGTVMPREESRPELIDPNYKIWF